MYDAPLISPENKDSSAEIFASLPKIVLSAAVPAGQSVADAVSTTLNELDTNGVIYAELRLNPADFADSLNDASLADAISQATAAIQAHKVDARIILTANTGAANVAEIADAAIAHEDVVGFALVGENTAAHVGVLKKLQDNFVPVVVEGGFEDIEAGVKAGATRVAVGVDIIDDFAATVEGIEPGKMTSWIRDRHIAVETNPDEDIASGDVDSLADHPLPLLQQLGFTCAVGTTALTQ
ncbi:adenosine deaminase, partial [Corynebacterium casei]